MRLFEVPAVDVPPRPGSLALKGLDRKIQMAQNAVDDAQDELDHAVDELYRLRDERDQADNCWPPREVLLAVYGAPGNWPCEAAA